MDAQGVTTSLFVGEPLKTSGIRNPSATFLLGDSGYTLTSWMAASEISDPYENSGRVDSFYIPGLELNLNRTSLLDNADAITGRHSNKKINMVFIDGHQQRRSAELLSCGLTTFDPASLPQFWSP